jgi:hypothetical protein
VRATGRRRTRARGSRGLPFARPAMYWIRQHKVRPHTSAEKTSGSLTTTSTLSWPDRVVLAVRIWYWYVRVRLRLRRYTLNGMVEWLARTRGIRTVPIAPRRLGRIVARVLPFGVSGATCLTRSLILYRLLHRQGLEPCLVIGLPPRPKNHEAHAWVEVNGREVGPPPGRQRFSPLARYRADLPEPVTDTRAVAVEHQN